VTELAHASNHKTEVQCFMFSQNLSKHSIWKFIFAQKSLKWIKLDNQNGLTIIASLSYWEWMKWVSLSTVSSIWVGGRGGTSKRFLKLP